MRTTVMIPIGFMADAFFQLAHHIGALEYHYDAVLSRIAWANRSLVLLFPYNVLESSDTILIIGA